MRFKHIISFLLIIFILTTFSYGQNQATVKSEQALQSDVLYNSLVETGLNPKVQLLANTLSTDFPYNIILEFNPEKEKKLVLVFPQTVDMYLTEIINFVNYFQTLKADYALDIVFSANDSNPYYDEPFKSETPMHVAQGSLTYIQASPVLENLASVIILPEEKTDVNASNFQLFEELIEVTPGGGGKFANGKIVPLSFFSTTINSFAKSGIPYYLKGYFLTLYRLNFIESNYVLNTWLNNEIPAVAVNLNQDNRENLFSFIETLFIEFENTDFANTDTNYSFIQVLSQTFFITEYMFLILIICIAAVILFVFFNVSFVTGVHRHIHKKEFFKTWYLIPVIVFSTGLFLLLSQSIIQIVVPPETNLPLFSFILKIALSVLFLLLFSLLQYVVKLPITGFIYAYMLSISAAINILIFSLVEITLAPLFIGQYIIVQISQRMRRIVPIIICFILMTAPYLPLAFNILNSNELLNISSILYSSFLTNILLACFMLPFQIMIIRILTRLKLWGMRLKINKEKIKKQIIFVSSVTILLIIISAVIAQLFLPAKSSNKLNVDEIIHISNEQKIQFGNILQTLEIHSDAEVIRYKIELEADAILPIYDANYPFEILTKESTAVFELDDYPPNPLRLTFTTQGTSDVFCKISAWVKINSSIEKLYIEYTFKDEA